MKILNKIIPCLIIASFIFSGEGFALKRNNNDERRSLPTKHRSIQQRLKPLPKRERAISAKPRKPSIQKSRTPRRPEAASKRSTRSKQRVSRPVKRPAKAPRTTAPRKSRSTPANLVDKPVATPKVKKAKAVKTAPVDKPVAAPKVKKAKTVKTAPVDKPIAAPKAKKAKAVKTAPVDKPIAAPKVKKAKAVKTTQPQSYLIDPKKMPKDLRNDLRTFLQLEEDDEDTVTRITPIELKHALVAFKTLEDHAPGITQRTRAYLATQGYNPNNNNDVIIDAATIPADLKYYLDMVEDVDLDDESPSFTVSSAEITHGLNKMQQHETVAQNMTSRLTKYLKSKYGFEG